MCCGYIRLLSNIDNSSILSWGVHDTIAVQVKLLMDLVCSSCGELMEDAVKKNMRIRVLASDTTKVCAVTAVIAGTL